MSIVVKTWRPAEGCEQCRQAEREMDRMTRGYMRQHAEHLVDVRERGRLRAVLSDISILETDWTLGPDENLGRARVLAAAGLREES